MDSSRVLVDGHSPLIANHEVPRILCLQLIIDPACSIFFEAEPLDSDAMYTPPRSPLSLLAPPDFGLIVAQAVSFVLSAMAMAFTNRLMDESPVHK